MARRRPPKTAFLVASLLECSHSCAQRAERGVADAALLPKRRRTVCAYTTKHPAPETRKKLQSRRRKDRASGRGATGAASTLRERAASTCSWPRIDECFPRLGSAISIRSLARLSRVRRRQRQRVRCRSTTAISIVASTTRPFRGCYTCKKTRATENGTIWTSRDRRVSDPAGPGVTR